MKLSVRNVLKWTANACDVYFAVDTLMFVAAIVFFLGYAIYLGAHNPH